MNIRFLLLLSLLLSLPGLRRAHAQQPKRVPQAQPPAQTLTGLRRVYSDNSTWTIATAGASAGISLKNAYADGSEWLVSAASTTYHIKRTYNDDSEWRVTETGAVLRQAYAHDNTEWRVQRGAQAATGAAVALRDLYKDGSRWEGEGFGLNRKFADSSAWTITDQAPALALDVKLLLVFAALYSDLNRP